MRGLAVITAVAAVWTLAGLPLPRVRRPAVEVTGPGLFTGLAAGAVVGTVVLGLTGVPAVAVGIGVLAGGLPTAMRRHRERRTAARAVERWPDFLAMLQGRLAGGASLPESFIAAARQTGGELERAAGMIEQHLLGGASFPAALDALRLHLADPVADRVLLTLDMSHRTGGPRVAGVLSALAESISDEIRLRKAHDAALTQQRLTALVALLAPWALLVLTVSTNPAAAAAYRSGAGPLVVAGGLAATLIGYWLARRAARLSRPPRVFR